jgi:heme ABC exporter ATP-binding subunit CcmA
MPDKMPADTPLLLARDLTKTFGRFTALRSLSLAVPEGEFLTIVGRNGAGKTTFLKIVSSIVRSYTGEVLLGGRNLKDADEDTRRKIGFVSHESLLYKDLTVRDNLSYYARMYGVPDRDRKIDEMIRRVGLDAKSTVLVSALSRGMKQRLSLARAFIHEPSVLLLDEPFTGLDERASEILEEVLAEFKRSRGTVIMVTHDIDRGWTHADRVVVFEKGTVAHEISARETSPDVFKDEYRRILGA